jgi:hypothetical protein
MKRSLEQLAMEYALAVPEGEDCPTSMYVSHRGWDLRMEIFRRCGEYCGLQYIQNAYEMLRLVGAETQPKPNDEADWEIISQTHL